MLNEPLCERNNFFCSTLTKIPQIFCPISGPKGQTGRRCADGVSVLHKRGVVSPYARTPRTRLGVTNPPWAGGTSGPFSAGINPAVQVKHAKLANFSNTVFDVRGFLKLYFSNSND